MKKRDKTAKILIFISAFSIIISTFIVLTNTLDTKAFFNDLLSQKPEKIKVLIVAGHEPDAGGADEFKKIKERDLNLQLATQLRDTLSKDQNIEVLMVRDERGWNTELESFVTTNEKEIMGWVSEMKQKMFAAVDAGKMELINPDMKHNEAASNAVLFLYGTNKWIEEKNIDLVLHIHFNSNPKINGKPNYRGYAMYVPEKQYTNASSSLVFANYLYNEIDKIQKKSNMPQEKDTIIEDQELVATGNYNTLKIPSVVIEYAYMYEPIMVNTKTRNTFIETAASSTAVAIEKYIAERF